MFGVAVSALATGVCLGVLIVGLGGIVSSRVLRRLRATVVAATLWCLGVLIMRGTTGLVWEQIGLAVGYAGGIFAPVLWWALANLWARERALVFRFDAPLWWKAPLVFGGLMYLAVLTNPWHHAVVTPVDGARNTNGPLWWGIAVPGQLCGWGTLAIGLMAVLRATSREVRIQGALFAGGSALVAGGHLAGAFSPYTLPFDAPTLAVAFSLGLATVAVRADTQRREYARRLEREVGEKAGALRALQARLVQAKRLEAGEHLAGAVAHAINNPLAALIGTLEFAVEEGATPESREGRSLRLAKRIRAVVERTLLLFRRGELKLDAIDGSALVNDFARRVRERLPPDVRFQCAVPDGLPILSADRELLFTALDGLVQNAFDAMPDGGVLSLDAEARDRLLILSITDTGPGLPKVRADDLFEPFFTMRSGGNGLGLAIARAVISGHRGFIRPEHPRTGGARFVVELPTE